MNIVYLDTEGRVIESTDCDECGVVFSDGVMSIVGEVLDEVSGRIVPEARLFCCGLCAETYRRRHA